MPEISQKNMLATLVLDFKVEPDKIQQLSKIVQINIEEVMSKKPGFVSASLHESSDGTRFVNYSQWKSRQSYETALSFLTKDEVSLGEKLLELGDMNWNFYDIVSSVGKTPSEISSERAFPTGINIITVSTENCKKLIESLTEYANNVLKKQDGFVSANIHKSLDAKRVINYVQWKSFDGLTSLFSDGEAQPYFKSWKEISNPAWNLFKVVYTT
ncbi:MAG: antibiotic biosynthesis monooxygenase [Nitrosopumilaceae archaeon]